MLPFQYMNDSLSLPVYKTRGFWITIVGLLFTIGLLAYSLIFPKRFDASLPQDLALALGGGLFMSVGLSIFDSLGRLVGAAIFLVFYLSVLSICSKQRG